ncbi:MAG: histidine kinase [Bryobacteraceae bacterium]|nr:histidine kinase [Bryobacteraceae bacterium]
MDIPHQPTDAQLLAQTLGFSAGFAISVVLLQLIRNSWQLEEQRRPSLLLAAALLVWNTGGAISTALMIGGYPFRSPEVRMACGFGYSGLLMFTPAMLSVWRLSHLSPRLRRIYTVLLIFAVVVGILLGIQFWLDAFTGSSFFSPFHSRVVAFTSFYVLLAVAIAVRLFEARSSLVNFCLGLSSAAFFASVSGIILSVQPSVSPTAKLIFRFAAEHSILLPALASFFLLARFRLSDVLVVRSLRILAALTLAFLFCVIVLGPLPHWAEAVPFPRAAEATIAILLLAALLKNFPSLEAAIGRMVERRFFQQPDFTAELNRFASAMTAITEETSLFRQAESSVTRLFEHTQAQVIPTSTSVRRAAEKELLAAEVIEAASLPSGLVDLASIKPEICATIRVNGRVDYLLAIAPDVHSRSFLHNELAFFRSLAALVGARLDALVAERDRLEVHGREMTLRQQATSAELQALRAQVNPHFLFNALNTIADLVIVDPRKAERAIEMLAETFRYVLMNHHRNMVSVGEELDFVQQYLAIEQVRFGSRLEIRIDADAIVRKHIIPALILQPVVENAIKHGLAPKIGPGLLTIQVCQFDGFLRLSVEDNGAGPLSPRKPLKSTGTGLRNTADRLRTLYQERACLTMEPLPSCGCRVTILIPQNGQLEAA